MEQEWILSRPKAIRKGQDQLDRANAGGNQIKKRDIRILHEGGKKEESSRKSNHIFVSIFNLLPSVHHSFFFLRFLGKKNIHGCTHPTTPEKTRNRRHYLFNFSFKGMIIMLT